MQNSQHHPHITSATIMKVTLLCLDTATKSSLISDSVTKTRIKIHHTGENLITWYTHDLSDPMYANISQRQSRSRSRSHLSLLHVFHVIPLRAICGWPIHYPDLHHYRNGEVSSDSTTINATKFTGGSGLKSKWLNNH
jgi:hypothetical protein